MPEPLLTVRDLEAWYGESHILHGVDLEVRTGEVVTLLGRNGAGKTTTLKSVMGIVERRRGSVRFGAAELIRLPSNLIARLGLAFCPEERGIFASLSVEENLMLPPAIGPGGLDRGAIFDLFPNLRERLRTQGTKLSGGEQQMLAIGRILRGGARRSRRPSGRRTPRSPTASSRSVSSTTSRARMPTSPDRARSWRRGWRWKTSAPRRRV